MTEGGGVPEAGVLLPIHRVQETIATLLWGAFLAFTLWGWHDTLTRGGHWRQPSSTGEAIAFGLIGLIFGAGIFWLFVGEVWRVLDGHAILWFDAEGLHCHPSIGPASIAWQQIRDLRVRSTMVRYGSMAIVELDLTRRYRGWYAPIGTKRLRIRFGAERAAANEARWIIRRKRDAACTGN